MATIDECIEFDLKNIGPWWRYGISRHCDEWKYITIGRIFVSEIILIPPSLTISESSSNGSYRNTDEVWWRYGISRSCDECFCSSNPVLVSGASFTFKEFNPLVIWIWNQNIAISSIGGTSSHIIRCQKWPSAITYNGSNVSGFNQCEQSISIYANEGENYISMLLNMTNLKH
jgi:hypothetical protein